MELKNIYTIIQVNVQRFYFFHKYGTAYSNKTWDLVKSSGFLIVLLTF